MNSELGGYDPNAWGGTGPPMPCRHMRRWVNGLVDGSLSGLARWYTNMHVAGCPRCRAALEALRALRRRLQALREPAAGEGTDLSPARRSALDMALDAVDGRQDGGEKE